MSIEDFIIWVFCWVDEHLDALLEGGRLRQRGFFPKLSDAEVITMEIVGEFLGHDTDKGIWKYFSLHWKQWFPALGSRSQFAKQANNLWVVKQKIHQQLMKILGGEDDTHHMIDGFPIPICHFKRAPMCRLFDEHADYGYCASKGEHYYGFKGHLVMSYHGVITGITLTPASSGEREAAFEITENIQGFMLGDKGYLGQIFKQDLQAQGIEIEAPVKSNMIDPLPQSVRAMCNQKRRLVETVIGQLVEHFSLAKVRARQLWQLTNRVARKVVAHSLGILANRLLGNDDLMFEKIIAA